MTLMNMTGIILSNDPKTLYEGELRTNSSTRLDSSLVYTSISVAVHMHLFLFLTQ